MIPFQPFPKIPPIGFFQPISADPRDMMTDVEFLLGMLKKLNEVIKQTNQNTEFINNYSGKIEELEGQIADLYSDMDKFKADTTNEINARFQQIIIELNAAIATCLTQANAYTDSKYALLEDEIEQIVIGQITVYDPTTGVRSPLQTVIDNLYDTGRSDALTASEYDTLDSGDPLTATAYDAYELTAIEYDSNAKNLLV